MPKTPSLLMEISQIERFLILKRLKMRFEEVWCYRMLAKFATDIPFVIEAVNIINLLTKFDPFRVGIT